MQQFHVEANQAGQRFDKFLHKYLPNAGSGFLYKMLRKKNITLNGKKAEGKEILQAGDEIRFFLSEETFAKFSGQALSGTSSNPSQRTTENSPVHTNIIEYQNAYQSLSSQQISVLYEDSDVLILNKPAGLLTQKAEHGDVSLNEWMIGYLLHTGKILPKELTLFKPSVCNRLDRNTSGIVLCGISLKGSQVLSEIIRNRSIKKFYRTICQGELTEKVTLTGSLQKNKSTNTVVINPNGCDIQTAYEPIQKLKHNATYLEVELITGKTHQIRAHLSAINHPLMGDRKYGKEAFNKQAEKHYDLKHQLLHAYRVEFPVLTGSLAALSEKTFIAPLPQKFVQILEDMS